MRARSLRELIALAVTVSSGTRLEKLDGRGAGATVINLDVILTVTSKAEGVKVTKHCV